MRIHNATVQTLATFAREAGIWTTLNNVIPRLAKLVDGKWVDAELDLSTWSAEVQCTCDVDVTVRHPAAQHVIRRAAKFPGAAALGGERAKLRRHGASVVTFAVETFGRLGPQAETFLQNLDSAAMKLDHIKGWAMRERRQGWCARLNVVIQRAMARQLLEARGTYARPGR